MVVVLAAVFGLAPDVAVLALRPVLRRRFRAGLGISAGLWMLRFEIRQREGAVGQEESKTYHGRLQHLVGYRGDAFACGC